jgi:hypothetical protein
MTRRAKKAQLRVYLGLVPPGSVGRGSARAGASKPLRPKSVSPRSCQFSVASSQLKKSDPFTKKDTPKRRHDSSRLRHSLHLPCDDKNDVPKVQVNIPAKERGTAEPGIKTPVLVFQTEHDISHRVDTTIHPLGIDVLDLESVLPEQTAQRFPREIMKMSRRMDLAPFAASRPGYPTVEITSRQRENSPARERRRDFRDVKVRPGQVLDSVPKTNEIRWNGELIA